MLFDKVHKLFNEKKEADRHKESPTKTAGGESTQETTTQPPPVTIPESVDPTTSPPTSATSAALARLTTRRRSSSASKSTPNVLELYVLDSARLIRVRIAYFMKHYIKTSY